MTRFGLVVLAGLCALSLSLAQQTPPDKSAGVDKAHDLGKSANDVLDGLLPDAEQTKPPAPEQHPPKPPPLPSPPPPGLPVASPAPATQGGPQPRAVQAIVANVVQTDAQATTSVVSAAAPPPAQPSANPATTTGPSGPPEMPPRHVPSIDIEKLAYRQARSILRQTDPKSTGSIGESMQREVSRTAWEGTTRVEAVPVIPQGTRFFSNGVPAALAPQEPAASAARPSASQPPILPLQPTQHMRTTPPPPPAPSPSATTQPLSIKGVRIAFDPVALELASRKSNVLGELEDRLLQSRGNDATWNWLEQRINEALSTGVAMEAIDHVGVVSLRQLGKAAQAYRANWSRLPENLRHPGSLRRIHGFLVDVDRDDVLLIGTSEGKGDPIDIDDLIVAVRSVWRDGATPICSLDPQPWNMGGPQQSVIAGVPMRSHFAQVMLDADYEMKKILFGQGTVPIEGLKTLRDAMLAANALSPQGKEQAVREFMARFWFTTVPPGDGAIRLSPDSRLALYDMHMQVQTEAMINSGATLSGTGTRNPIAETATRSFTQHLPALEQEYPIFRQLQSLYDICLTATLLERLAACPAVLTTLADLPISDVDVPESYAGLTVVLEQHGLKSFHLQGGVQIQIPLASTTLVRVRDAGVEDFVSRVRPGEWVSEAPEGTRLRVVQGTDKDDATASRPVADLNRLIAEDPSNAEHRKRRAEILIRRKLFHVAEYDLCVAAAVAPDDLYLRTLYLFLRVERGEPIDRIKPSVVQALVVADMYRAEAVLRERAGAVDDALKALDRAAALGWSKTDILVRRAQIQLSHERSAAGIASLSEAIQANPTDARLYVVRAEALCHAERLQDAVADASHALELNPKIVQAYLLRALARVHIDEHDTRQVHADLKRWTDLGGRHAGGFVVRSYLLRQEGDADGALAAANEAVALLPAMPEARLARALVYANAVLPDGNPNALVTSKQAEAVVVLQDLNVGLHVQPGNVQMRILRAQMLLAYLQRLGDAQVDWPKILPAVAEAVDHCPNAAKLLADVAIPETPEQVVVFQRQFKLAFIQTIVDDLMSARPHAPECMHAEIDQQLALLRNQFLTLSKEGTP